MKKQLFLVFLLLSCMTFNAQVSNNKYEKEWELIKQYEKESLPQSAEKQLQIIFRKAIDEKNTQQVIKSLIYRNKYKLQIDNQAREGIFADLQELLSGTNDLCERALIHSMLGEQYVMYYNSNPWRINQRTNLMDTVPSDMKEWSKNIFLDKIVENFDLSVKDMEVLKKRTTKDYSDIIYLGSDGEKYYPTLYDFLMDRAIQISKELIYIVWEEFDPAAFGLTPQQLVLPADEYTKLDIQIGANKKYIVFAYYSQYMKDLSDRGLIPTLILTEIDKVSLLSDWSQSLDSEKILDAYKKLEATYKDNPACVEIIDAMIRALYRQQESLERNETIYNLALRGIEKYPEYYRIDILKNHLATMEEPRIRVEAEKLFYPGKSAIVKVFYKNVQALPEPMVFVLYSIQKGNYKRLHVFSENLTSAKTYAEDSLKLDIGKMDVGNYMLGYVSKSELNSDIFVPALDIEESNRIEFVVSSLMTFSRNSGKDEYEIYVVGRNNGNPVKNVTVNIYDFKNSDQEKDAPKLLASLKTNDMGLVLYKDTRVYKENEYRYNIGSYKVALGADSCLRAESLYAGNYIYPRFNPQEETEEDLTVNIFTDRNIYRPGQTVYYKAIATNIKSQVLANKTLEVELYDANGQLLFEKELTTNEFGSVSGEFILPQSALLGQYRLKVEDAESYFNVEEYKRPTFEVTFDKIDKTYTFGQEIRLKGFAKSFSGISLQSAGVEYSITREPFSFWFWRNTNSTDFTDGRVETKDDGSFEIIFTPETGDGNKNLFRKQIYTFNITATVTDLNGETQSNNYRLSVGEVSMVINIDISDQIEKTSKDKITIGAKNLDGEDLKKSGSYAIYSLNRNDSVQHKILNGNFETGEQVELRNKLKTLASGKYQLQVKALDDRGNEIVEEKNFVLYSYADARPPFETNEWVVTKNNIFKENTPVEIIYGVTDKDVHVLYQLYNNKKVFERKFVKMSNANRLFKVAYKDEFGENLYMSFTYVKDGNLYHKNIALTKEKVIDDPNLYLKLEVFRDKLRPGQQETWTLSVKDVETKPAKAELMASMYDTSLDKLNPYRAWSFNRPFENKEYVYPIYFNQSGNYSKWDLLSTFNLGFDSRLVNVKYLQFDRINWFGYTLVYLTDMGRLSNKNLNKGGVGEYGSEKMYAMAGSGSSLRARRAVPLEGKAAGVMVADVASPKQSLNLFDSSTNGEISDQPIPPSAPQIRRNFNETAFFFPQLRTNEKGETLISFTVPESNTTWRFRALAHDKQSRVGQLEQLIVTRKELMITPNMPRFVRQGDKTSISTKISNLSDKAIAGEVRIEFFDPLTEKIIDLNIVNQKQVFSLDKDASSSASWMFDVPMDIELLGCRIVAQSEMFSDGEQHALAVLPNRMLVTESMPIEPLGRLTAEQIAGKETLRDSFTLDKLYNNKSASSTNYKLTLEFASNPAWYAIQALPTLSNPNNENAVNWFAGYYVNTLGRSIIRQYPKVGAMIEAWKKQGGSKETLMSNLQKNEELKTIILEETPWVLDAKNETEQMQRLSLLFDLNNTAKKTDLATQKLGELQDSQSGAWAWYRGMYPSRSITQYILYGYAKLQLVGQVEYPQKIKEMQISALRFIDKQITDDFVNLKKYNTKWQEIKTISTSQLEYMYVRSSYRDIPITLEAREAERFYTSVVSKNWTKLDLYQRSLLLVVLLRNGDKDLAAKIAKSIREHAVIDNKMGMYWPNNRSSVFMSQSAVTTHVFLMDALKEIGASEEEMDMMKRWLLRQKQTQQWESTHATIDAIGALLSSGSDWFAETPAVNIKVGNEKVVPENKDLGTGYFKETWHQSEINNNMGKVEIEYGSNEPAYGALYWQYFEDMDKITAHKGGLNVEKQLFKETVTPAGKGLKQITENNPLTVGEKVIVRLTIRTDRDMEFVQLKDMRAPCFEPLQTLSGMSANGGLFYYQTVRDASTNFFFDTMPRGTYVIEYPVYVNRSGSYSNGITTIQCMYAPEFISHTQGIKVTVKDKE